MGLVIVGVGLRLVLGQIIINFGYSSFKKYVFLCVFELLQLVASETHIQKMKTAFSTKVALACLGLSALPVNIMSQFDPTLQRQNKLTDLLCSSQPGVVGSGGEPR